MQPPLSWNAVVIIAHPVLRLAIKDLLYCASGFIQLFMIKWELCSTSGQFLVSEVQKSLNFPRQNSDKLCWYAIASSYHQHHINCAQWILRTGQFFLHLWNWNITATVVREASYIIVRFLCLGCFFTLQDTHAFVYTLEDVRELKDRKNQNSLHFCFGIFLSSKMSVVDWLHMFHLDTCI